MTETSGAPAAVATPTRLAVLESAIAQVFPEGLIAVAGHTGELTYEVPVERLLSVATVLRDHDALKFELCMDVCGVDLP